MTNVMLLCVCVSMYNKCNTVVFVSMYLLYENSVGRLSVAMLLPADKLLATKIGMRMATFTTPTMNRDDGDTGSATCGRVCSPDVTEEQK